MRKNRQLSAEAPPVGKQKRRCPKRSMARKRKYAMLQDWYAIVLRKEPERILAIDRTLSRAQITVRLYYPEISPRELAFLTLSQDEYLQIIASAGKVSVNRFVDCHLSASCPGCSGLEPWALYTSRFERTAKRFNRTAQAFRPGKAPSKFALKGRPTGADENEYLAIHVERSSHSAALSGRIPSGKNPGLEGLGYGL